MTPEQFRESWPRVLRAMVARTGDLDDAEEAAAEAFARAAAYDAPIDDLTAWCLAAAQRIHVDAVRRRAVARRYAPEIARDEEAAVVSSSLDDRLALLLIACDPELSENLQLVLALRLVCGLSIEQIAAHLGATPSATAARLTRAKKALAATRPAYATVDGSDRGPRLPAVRRCIAGMFSVAHHTDLSPADASVDLAANALSLANALVAIDESSTESRGLRAVIRLALARRPGRVGADGAAVPLDEADRSMWDRRLLREGLADATFAAQAPGRFALEAAIAGLHSKAATYADTDWPLIVTLYGELERRWPSPAVTVGRLIAEGQDRLRTGEPTGDIEQHLELLVESGPAYAARDAAFALADLEYSTGRREQARERYLRLAETPLPEPVRLFCLNRAQPPAP